MSWTKSGTVSLTNNSKIVYGSGTSWASGGLARAGDMFVAPGGWFYEVESIQSNTQLTLVNAYLGATASGQSYALVHTGLLPAELAVALSDLQSKYLATIAQLYEWETSTADTVPITNPATGVTSNVKPLQKFLAALTDGATSASFSSINLSSGVGYLLAGTKPNGVGYFEYQSSLDFYKGATKSFGIDSGGQVGQSGNADFLGYSIRNNGASAVNTACCFLEARNEVNSAVSAITLGIGTNGGSWVDFSTQPSGSRTDRRAPRLRIQDDGHIRPGVDNSQSFGTASFRWTQVYAANGTINTSDAREKTDVRPLTGSEIAASAEILKKIGGYRWLHSVAEKGDAAREHIGLTVQSAIEVMKSHGLNPFGYGFICYDKWDKQVVEHPDEYEQIEIPEKTEVIVISPAVFDDFGHEFVPEKSIISVIEPARTEQGKLIRSAWTETTREAGELYGFRYDQLSMFLLRGIDARLEALESAK